MLTFKRLNLENWISFYRIISVPILMSLIWMDNRFLFAVFLSISYLIDGIDNYLLRQVKIRNYGRSQIDAAGDQLTIFVGLVGLFYFETDFILGNTGLILLALIPYAIQFFIAFIKYGRSVSFHTYLAKVSAVLQGAFILWTLFIAPSYLLFYMVILTSILETIEKIALIFMYKEWVADVKSLYWALKDERRRHI